MKVVNKKILDANGLHRDANDKQNKWQRLSDMAVGGGGDCGKSFVVSISTVSFVHCKIELSINKIPPFSSKKFNFYNFFEYISNNLQHNTSTIVSSVL